MLGKHIVASPNKKQVLDTILAYIVKNDPGLEHLYKSLVGIDFSPSYKIGTEWYAKLSSLGTWQFDQAQTEAAGLTFQGRVVVKIIEINKYSQVPYKVEFIAKDGGKDIICKSQVMPQILEEREKIEFIEDPPF
jgi:hypothetical protein